MPHPQLHSPAPAAHWLWVILAVSVLLRVGSALYQGATIEPLPGVADQTSYHELAIRVGSGHGFSFETGWWPATRAGEPTAHWSYLYVLFLAGIYAVTGPLPLAARLIQAVLVGVVHPLLAWRVGRRLFNPAVGLAAAALTSLYGYFIFYAGSLVTESLFFVAFLWTLDLATALAASGHHAGRSGFSRWAVLGLGLAVGVLLRQAFLLMIPFILAWIVWQAGVARGRRPRMAPRALAARMAVALTVLAAAIAPWTLRNYEAFGRFVPLNTNAGFVFFWGNHPVHGVDFIPILPQGAANYGDLLPRDLAGLNEAELDQALLARGVGFVMADPVRYVRLSLSRAREYFKFWPSADSGAASNLVRVLSFGILLPLLLHGFWLVWRKAREDGPDAASGVWLFLAIAALYSLVHLLTWTLVRYRLPVDAITIPFAAVSIVYLIERVPLAALTRASGFAAESRSGLPWHPASLGRRRSPGKPGEAPNR